VIDASSAEFDAQVAMLRRYFDVIGLEELRQFLAGKPLAPNPAIITFDDGYRDCHARALPILQKHGVKAAFFVATSYVSERRIFWWDRISYVIEQSSAERLRLTYPYPIELDLQHARAHAVRVLLDVVKRHFRLDLERFLGELTEAAGVAWSREVEREFAAELVMSWDEVRALRAAGMEIHSHTRTHRILQTLPLDELADELGGARDDLERELGEPVRAVSYPVGRSVAAAPPIRRAVHEAGYDLGFSNTSGVTWTSRPFDPLDIRRISVEHGLPMPYFRALLALPPFAESAWA
jgi:peptidoglycan/xylan/chitin deacetylase (PgdA/CDA1 family)